MANVTLVLERGEEVRSKLEAGSLVVGLAACDAGKGRGGTPTSITPAFDLRGLLPRTREPRLSFRRAIVLLCNLSSAIVVVADGSDWRLLLPLQAACVLGSSHAVVSCTDQADVPPPAAYTLVLGNVKQMTHGGLYLNSTSALSSPHYVPQDN